MTTVRSLANLDCAKCGEQTLHNYGRCIRCDTSNDQSGQAPIPKPYERYNTIRNERHNAAVAEQGSARRRARAARHQVMQRSRS